MANFGRDVIAVLTYSDRPSDGARHSKFSVGHKRHRTNERSGMGNSENAQNTLVAVPVSTIVALSQGRYEVPGRKGDRCLSERTTVSSV